jgi:hypothetical protein
MMIGHLIFAVNLFGLLSRLGRAAFAAAMVANVKPAEVAA